MRKNKQKIRLILLILLATLLLSCYLFTIVKLERLTASSWRAEEDEDEAEDGFVMAQCQKILEGGFVLGVGDGKNGGGDDGDIEKVGNNYGEKNNNVNKYDNNNNNNKYDNNNNNNNELNNIKMPSFYDVSSQSKSQNNRNNNDNKDINSYVVSKINNRNDNEEINNNNNGNNDNNKFLVKICRSYIKKIKRKNETKNKKWMNKMKNDGWKENEKKGVKDEQMKDGWIEDEWMDRKRKKEKKILKNIMTDFMAGRAYDWEDDGKKDETMGGLFPDWMKDRVGGRSDEKMNEKIDRRKNGETEKTNENDRGIDKEADRKMGGRMDEYKLKKEDLDLLSNLIGQHQKYRRQKLQMEDDEFYEMKKKYATYLNIHPYVPNMPVWKVFQNRISNFSLYQLDYNPTNHYQNIFHNNNDNNNNDDNNNNNNNNNNDNGEDNDEDNYKKYNNEGRLDNNNNKDNNNNDNNNNNNNNISNAKMVASLLSKLATLKITFVTELPFSGTQIKYILTLNHTYNAIFKPKRVSRDDEESMDTYYMYEKERHTAEIAAFHLDRIFGFMRVPPTAGRVVNIVTDIKEHLPHHSKKNFYLSPVNNLCFFGKCRYFCDPAHAVCGAGEALEGSLGAFLPNKSQASWHSLKNPWSRSYSKHNKSYWEKNLDGEEVCNHFRSQHPFTTLTSILNLIDIHIFDFLLGNKDRHHFTSFHQFRNSSTFVLIDNGKGFGRSQDITDILAPLTQCCLVRYTTLKRLYHFQTHTPLSQLMATSLSQDVLPNILPTKHLKALDRRVMIVLMKVLECVSKASSSHHVIKDDDVIAT